MSSHYDPATGSIELGADPTPYQLAHERAHQWQQLCDTRAWRWHRIGGRWPYLGRILRLWLEWEASVMALRALEHAGRCDHHARAESRRGIWSYIRALTIL